MKLLLSYRRHVCFTCALLPALAALPASAAAPATPQTTNHPANGARAYTVVNLAPGAGLALLNRQGQAAFATYSAGNFFNGFFDGANVVGVAAPGGGYALVSGLNDHGVVVGQFDDPATAPPFNYRAFTWTVRDGLRALPGAGTAVAHAINNRNQAAGTIKGKAFYGRAYRWNPDSTATELGPLPASLSEALAINDSGVSVGYGDLARYDSHAFVWDASGATVDLGTMGGNQSVAKFVNVLSQVVGTYYRDGIPGGFLWSRRDGLVKIAPERPGGTRVTGLNDHGEVAVNGQVAANDGNVASVPFVWSTRQGLRPLPLGGAVHGSAEALNNRNDVVGYVEHTPADPLSRRAVLWRGAAAPVDLNTLLYRAPAGLVLYAATAVNDRGDILADANVGLVLLRPGVQGASAPVLGPIGGNTGADPVPLGAQREFSVNFVGATNAATHVATAQVDDGCPQEAPSLREVRGSGTVDLRHTFCRAGSFGIRIKISDRAGHATEVWRSLAVADAATMAPR